MLRANSRLAVCEQHIANIQSRMAELTALPEAGSGFLHPADLLSSMQRTLDRWIEYRQQLLSEIDGKDGGQ
jgi:hypothetical protein